MDTVEIAASAREIANALEESNRNAIGQLERLIEHMGLEFVQEQLAETQRVQAEGGLMTNKGDRKRSMGGVFFYITKPKLPEEQRKLIFPPRSWKAFKAKQKRRKAARRQQEAEQANLPSPAPTEMNETDQLSKLQNAAETLRQRITDMEAKGQKGVSMTKTLLKNTEKQIEKLRQVLE